MSLFARVRQTIATRGLLTRGMRVLAACSGGPDSAAMLGALSQLAPELGFALEAASVDHGLRAEAKLDLEIARQQAASMEVPFHALAVQVGEGASVQAHARLARYAALSELARELGTVRIAVGHTRDDQAETVLQRLLRGASVRGLSAIEPLRADGVIRPLIDAPRRDVHAFARAHFPQIAWDPTNLDPQFTRVRVRESLIPMLEREDPALSEHLSDLADDAREHSEFVEKQGLSLLGRARVDSETLAISALLEAPGVLRRAALRAFLTEHELPAGRAHLSDLDAACGHGRGEVWLNAAFCMRVENGGILRLRARP